MESRHADSHRKRGLLVAVLLALLASGCGLFGSARPAPLPPPPPAATRDGRWQQDIAYLVAELPRQHPDAFFRTSQAEFESAAAALSERVPKLQDDEVVVGLCRVVALLGDGHTVVEWPSPPRAAEPAALKPGGLAPVTPPPAEGLAGFGSYPLQLRCFTDGVYATTTTAHGAVALRGRLLAIGEVPVDEAVERAAALTARDNEAVVLEQLPQLLTTPEVVHALGLSETPQSATYLFERPPGVPDDGPPPGYEGGDAGDEDPPPPEEPPSPTVELSLAPMRAGNRYEWRRAPEELPLCAQHPDRTYWLTTLPDKRTVFAQYNACHEDSDYPFADFARSLLAALDASADARLVLDLRRNGGGDSSVIEPLLDGLDRRRQLTGPRLCVLIGRGTYSSAMMNAWELRRDYGARLVGEPTGGNPDGWGELAGFDLPNSRLHVHHSTRRFALVPGASSLMPDVTVPETSVDWFAGRDAALEAALAGVP